MKMNSIMFPIATIAAIVTFESCKFVSFNAEKISERMEKRAKSSGVVTISDSTITTLELTDQQFNAISCSGGYDVEYVPGECLARLSGPKSYIEHLLLECNNGVLEAKTDGTKFRNWKNVKLFVSCPTLEKIEAQGSVDLNADYGVVSNADLSIDISGAADMNISSLTAKNVKLRISGAGDIDIKGLCCDCFDGIISGAGDMNLEGISDTLKLQVNGAANVDIHKLSCKTKDIKKAGIASIRQ